MRMQAGKYLVAGTGADNRQAAGKTFELRDCPRVCEGVFQQRQHADRRESGITRTQQRDTNR